MSNRKTELNLATNDGAINSGNEGVAQITRQKFSEQAVSFLSSRPGDNAISSARNSIDATKPTDGSIVTGRFSPSMSPQDLVSAGKIKELPRSPEGSLEFPNLTDKTPPKISVEMQDLSKPQEKPNFIIKQNGEVEMHGNPETLNSKDIKVVLERKTGQLAPTDDQIAASNELVQYLSQRLRNQNEELKRNGLEISDANNVLSPETKIGTRRPADMSGLSPETEQSVGKMNRFRGNGGGEAPMSSTQDYFPPRDVPRQTNESDTQAALKESVAGLVNPDKTAPYETVRQSPHGDLRVGRYGFSGRQISSWLDSLNLGDPPDPALIEKLISEGKLPKGFNAQSLGKLRSMASKMESGGALAGDEVKLLPKELQERIATDLINSYKGTVGNSPGDIATAMMSGKPANELTPEDLKSPQASQLKDAGQRLYDIATARQKSNDGNDKIEWTPEGKVSIGNGKWLDGGAGTAFKRAQELAAADGVRIEVNSAGRTFAEQTDLYRRRGTAGVSQVVAKPGTSNHEVGNALDVQNWQRAKPYLVAAGFVQGDGRGPISNDLVHFKYVGGNSRNA